MNIFLEPGAQSLTLSQYMAADVCSKPGEMVSVVVILSTRIWLRTKNLIAVSKIVYLCLGN